MTTTSTFQGMESIEKPTSRVINPPGGQSNFSLGWDGSEEAKQNGDQQPQAEGEPKPDMVFGPMIIETRPGSGKKHFEKREVDTKSHLFGESAPLPDKKPGSNRRNVSTLYMGGDVADEAEPKPSRRQYPTRESNSFAAVYCREGQNDTGAGNINPITGAPESHKKHVKPQEGSNPIIGGFETTDGNTPGSRRQKPDRLKPEDLPAAGVRAYEDTPNKQSGRIPPGGKSGGIF